MLNKRFKLLTGALIVLLLLVTLIKYHSETLSISVEDLQRNISNSVGNKNDDQHLADTVHNDQTDQNSNSDSNDDAIDHSHGNVDNNDNDSHNAINTIENDKEDTNDVNLVDTDKTDELNSSDNDSKYSSTNGDKEGEKEEEKENGDTKDLKNTDFNNDYDFENDKDKDNDNEFDDFENNKNVEFEDFENDGYSENIDIDDPIVDVEYTSESDSLRVASSKLLEAAHFESDPESPEDSSYAQTETENELVDEDTIIQQIKDIIDSEEKVENINPPDLERDWSIKIDVNLLDVTSKDFRKGNKITKDFFTQLLNLIHGNRLSYPLQQRMAMENGKTIVDPILFYDSENDRLSESDCESFLNFPEEFIEDLTIKHKIIVDNLPDITPNFYEGAGYVIVGGGKYSWFSLLVIEVLRKFETILPVEVIIPTIEDYEFEFCENILPQYNARCIKIYDVFDDEVLRKIGVTGYQYKSLALLASSFEHAFLLDSDTYPMVNPEELFTSTLYHEKTMITWPDYWRRTTSPHFYKIRGTEVGKRVRHLNDFFTDLKYFKVENEDIDDALEADIILKHEVPLHDREGTLPDWTTESGEMLINKKVHFKALLLALYYNLDGQFGYYPLLSQGGAGEGDKETFVAASNFYGLNYYQVNKMPDRAYGFYKYSSYFDTSIIQYSPLKDYENLQWVNREIQEQIEIDGDSFAYDYSSYFTDKFQIYNSVPMFYHVHETKMDPFNLVEIKSTEDLDGFKIRNLGGDFPRVDFDLEQFLWEKINEHLCVEKKKFACFEHKDDDVLCGQFMKEQLSFLKKSSYTMLKEYRADEPFDNLRRIY